MTDRKVHFKTLVWKFKDTTLKYPEFSNIPSKKVTSPHDFFDLFSPVFKDEPWEMFLVAWLSSSNRVQGFEIITVGNLNSSVVDPRGVFRSAIISNCANIIIAHNHPSGNPEPSNEDIAVTKRLVECGKLLDINIFDHLIFAGSSFTSFIERRLI